jgi:uncharacterized YigZ family protein
MLKSINKDIVHEIIIEKSRFICHLFSVDSATSAQKIIDEIKTEHNKASHNCYAYIIGAGSEQQKCSDDGEPGGTAGIPMLNILRYEGLSNILAIVTRYFGGIKLGTGGLSRAYAGSVKEALAQSTITTKYEKALISLTTDYATNEQIKYILSQHNASVNSINYGEEIVISFYIAENQVEILNSSLNQRLAQIINLNTLGMFFVE